MDLEKRVDNIQKILDKLLTKEMSLSTGNYLSGIILFHSGSNAIVYPSTDAGLDLASAAAVSGDVVVAYKVNFALEHTLTAGVKYYGFGSVFSEELTLNENTALMDATVSISKAGVIMGVSVPQGASMRGCWINVTSSSGNVYGISTADDSQIWDSHIYAITLDGIAMAVRTSGNPEFWNCDLYGDGLTSGYGIGFYNTGVPRTHGGRVRGTTADLMPLNVDQVEIYKFTYGMFPWTGEESNAYIYWQDSGGFSTPGCIHIDCAYGAGYGAMYFVCGSGVIEAGNYIKAAYYIYDNTLASPHIHIGCWFSDGSSSTVSSSIVIPDTWQEVTFDLSGFAGLQLTQVVVYGEGFAARTVQYLVDDIEFFVHGFRTKAILQGTALSRALDDTYGDSDWGDRGAWDVENYATRHASDINSGVLLRHLPLPGTAGNIAYDDGTKWTTASLAGAGLVTGSGTAGIIPQWAVDGISIEDSTLASTVSGGNATFTGVLTGNHAYTLPDIDATLVGLQVIGQVFTKAFSIQTNGTKLSLYEDDVSTTDALIRFTNQTGTAGVFAPWFYFKSNKTGVGYANLFTGDCTTDDVTDTGEALAFQARAVATQIVNRKLFAWYNDTLRLMAMWPNGNLVLGNSGVQLTSGGKLQIIGVADLIQFILRANATQTTNISEIQNSSGTVLASVSGIGAGLNNVLDAVTNTVTEAYAVGHDTSGTPASGFGVRLAAYLESSTTSKQFAGSIDWVWTTATHATRTSDIIFQSVLSGTSGEIWRMTSSGRFDGKKAGITEEGGYYIIVVAGENLSRGEIVQITQGAGGADGKVYKNAIDSDMPVGVVYADALANASVKIITSGIAYVLPEAGYTATRGYVIYSSNATAGRVDESVSVPAALLHFREVGHWLDTGSGNGAITRAVVHFN